MVNGFLISLIHNYFVLRYKVLLKGFKAWVKGVF